MSPSCCCSAATWSRTRPSERGEFRFAPLLADQLRTKRRGTAGGFRYLDQTYAKVAGRSCYLYRAVGRDGELIDLMLSEHRNKPAARRFLRRLIEVAGSKPPRVTTDHRPAYPRAIRWIVGRRVLQWGFETFRVERVAPGEYSERRL